ncbi:hypothetical protein BH10BAC2_BH10BAC2_08780 [soil metagenome]
MATINKPSTKVVTKNKKRSNEDTVVSKSKEPFIFISHDSRDAKIAEAFSELLIGVSAGILKSFRSSDRKGIQGIEFGAEWFTAIMDNLEKSSDVVCLLTESSLNRPWILYEAGIARGKLQKNVLGIGLGIPLSEINKGPFAQFQNSEDDEDSLTKLILQLIRRVQNSDPNHEAVKIHVDIFRNKLINLRNEPPQVENLNQSSASAAPEKLFEEVKIMFQDISQRILLSNERKGIPLMSFPSELKIIEAFYFTNEAIENVTVVLQNYIVENRINLFINNHNMLGSNRDIHPSIVKSLRVKYSYGNLVHEILHIEGEHLSLPYISVIEKP